MASPGLPADTSRFDTVSGVVRRLSPSAPGAGPTSLDPALLSRLSLALGFARIGVTSLKRFDQEYQAFKRWLSRGFAGEMGYLHNASARVDPSALMKEAKSLIVAALPYAQSKQVPARLPLLGQPRAHQPAIGVVASYARSVDYHDVVKEKLWALGQQLADALGKPLTARVAVDTAPLLEREAARRANISFTGKNTLSIIPQVGSFFVLGELLVDVVIEPTNQPVATGCGQCRRCLDACPTGAFVDEYVLDSRKCISYLTIEYRGVIPRELRPLMGLHVFGCDICQQTCPYNATSKAPDGRDLAPLPRLRQPDLIDLLRLRSGAYRRWVRGTAIRRVSRVRLARNAAVALGNSGSPQASEPLREALSTHAPLVRGHAAWALGRLPTFDEGAVRTSLRLARDSDDNAWVREEAALALKQRAIHRDST